MSTLTVHDSSTQAIALPEPRGGAISIRVAIATDIPFIDEWQKKHSDMVGFLPLIAIEKRMAAGNVLIAEQHGTKVGYVMSDDRYTGRDEVGIIYQLNVVPTKQRGLIGATLIKEVFHRAAYGCRLFGCWCAQDLEANYFWESIGFVPLAFRTGSRKKKRMDGTVGPRIHIYWQCRVRENDTQTSYWFPSETKGGAVKENRLALPIPPGTHWSDAKPSVLPGAEGLERSEVSGQKLDDRALTSDLCPLPSEKKPRARSPKKVVVVKKSNSISMGGLRFLPGFAPKAEKPKSAKREKPPKQKNDPKLVAAARELRDRYVEKVNEGLLLLPNTCGKYDVSRQLEAAPSSMQLNSMVSARLLNAA